MQLQIRIDFAGHAAFRIRTNISSFAGIQGRPETDQVSADAERIAQEISRLVGDVRADSLRDRKIVYWITGVMAVFVALIGSHIWGIMLSMNEDMESMQQSMQVITPAVPSMAVDTGHRGRDIDRMTPANGLP